MNLRTQAHVYFSSITNNVRVSFGQPAPIEPNALYFFYHIPKCGGMDFYGSLCAAVESKSTTKGITVFTGRADTKEKIDKQKEYNHSVPLSGFKDLLGIFASHVGDDAFRTIFPSEVYETARKVCFIRDPYSRAISDYTYTQMRKSAPVSKEGFRSFIQEGDNRNKISQSIMPGEDNIEALVKFAKTFYIFTNLERQSELLENLLSRHGLANVIRDPINKTLNSYRLDDVIDDNELRVEFSKLNHLDVELFNRLDEIRQEPDEITSQSVNINTLVVNPKQQEKAFTSKNYLLNTGDIVQIAARTPVYDNVSEFLVHFGINE